MVLLVKGVRRLEPGLKSGYSAEFGALVFVTMLASQFGSTLTQVPSPGAENDDHNPSRIASRNLFDLAIGSDNIFKGDRYRWSAQLTLINLANNYALYNFLSTFSGTHYVTPRAITAEIGSHF